MSIRADAHPVGIIGGGLGGLAAACTLAARGFKVVLFEKNGWLGGKAAQLTEAGYRFDMGPTILTMPSVLEKIFAEAGRRVSDYMELRRLDPQWRCFFDDGAQIDLRENEATMASLISAFSPGDERGFRQFMKMSSTLHDVSEKVFFWRSIEGVADTMRLRGMNRADWRDVLNLRMGTSVASQIRRRISDDRLCQMLDHFVQYVGSSPYQAPAVLCGIADMQTQEGIWYPMGGTRAVPLALERLARELGVVIRDGVDVSRITTQAGRVVGVVTAAGEAISLSAVISNMDSVRTMRELIGGAPYKEFARRWKRDPACSGVVLYLGLNRRYEHLAHHNFVFSKSPADEFRDIYTNGEPARDPTCYVAAPSGTDSAVAPDGGEALYILVHTPYLRPHHDWALLFRPYRQAILDKLKRTARMPDLEERIVFERQLTPQDIHDRYRVLNGAIYGLASHGKFNGAFKPGNRSRDVKGLYLAGGAAHPGPGMPMVLMSGWIAADSLYQDVASLAEPAFA